MPNYNNFLIAKLLAASLFSLKYKNYQNLTKIFNFINIKINN
jgi:hypothetical protein